MAATAASMQNAYAKLAEGDLEQESGSIKRHGHLVCFEAKDE